MDQRNDLDDNKSNLGTKQTCNQLNRQHNYIKLAINDINRMRQLTDDTILHLAIVRCEQLSSTIEEYREVLFCYLFEYYVVKTSTNEMASLNSRINLICDDVMKSLMVPIEAIQDL